MKVGSQIPEMHTLNLQKERFIDERNLQINLCFSFKGLMGPSPHYHREKEIKLHIHMEF